jgi:hypothetical protein
LKWREHLRAGSTWISYVSNNLEAVLFLLAALVTVCGFMRMLKRKRDYEDVDEVEEESKEK